MILLLFACGAADSAAVDDACAGTPSVSYESFGAAFMTQYCQTCHASTATDRHDAPESVTFDSAAEVWAQRDAVLRAVLEEPATMPPQGGVTDDDKTLLDAWLRCGTSGG